MESRQWMRQHQRFSQFYKVKQEEEEEEEEEEGTVWEGLLLLLFSWFG
jgi:hypothetical protein